MLSVQGPVTTNVKMMVHILLLVSAKTICGSSAKEQRKLSEGVLQA